MHSGTVSQMKGLTLKQVKSHSSSSVFFTKPLNSSEADFNTSIIVEILSFFFIPVIY